MAPQKKTRRTKRNQSAAPLSSELASVAQALQQAALRKKPTPAKAGSHLRSRYEAVQRQLQRESRKLEQLAAKAKIIAPRKAESPAPAVLPSVPGPRRASSFGGPAAAPKPDEKNVGPQFREFLSQVGAAMVDAQQHLDDESRRYLAGAVPAAMPAMFRLPRLNAKVQFDFSEGTGKDLNFVFYRNQSSTKESRQHLLEFEIVAAPPPPGFNPPVPSWRLLMGNERKNTLEAIDLGAGERLVLWELTMASNGLMFLLADAPVPPLGQLPQAQLRLIGPTKADMQSIPFQATADPAAPVSQIVAGLQVLADKQAAFVG